MLGKVGPPGGAILVAHQFGFFDGGHQLAVLQNGAGGIAADAADSQNDHLRLSRFSILAQVSFRASVRLNTGLPGVESGSTQKYARRSNW